MRLRTKWAVAGFLWGTLAGGIAAAGSVAVGAGFFWLYLSAGAARPAWSRLLLDALAVATVLGLIGAGALAGLRRGRLEEAKGRARDPDAHHRATRAALAAGLATAAALFALLTLA